jgi:hypothetical protein
VGLTPHQASLAGEFMSIKVIAATELDQTRDVMVTVPHPRRHIRIAVIGILAFTSLYLVLLAGTLYEFLTLAPSDRRPGALSSLVSDAIMWALILVCLARGFVDWNRPLVIFALGIDLRGLNLPWDRIVCCRWNRYAAGTLVITMNNGKAQIRQYASIPDADRPLVEKTLRDFGKWEN